MEGYRPAGKAHKAQEPALAESEWSWVDDPMSRTRTAQLSDYDQRVIVRAREMAALEVEDVRAFTGYEDRAEAFIAAFVRAQLRISELLTLVEDLTGRQALSGTTGERDR